MNIEKELSTILDKIVGDKNTEEGRKKRAENIKKLAKETNRDEDTIRAILSGKIKCPPPDVLKNIARTLNIPLNKINEPCKKQLTNQQQLLFLKILSNIYN